MSDPKEPSAHTGEDRISLWTPPGTPAIAASDTTPATAVKRLRTTVLAVSGRAEVSRALAVLAQASASGSYEITCVADHASASVLLRAPGFHAYLFDDTSIALLAFLPEQQRRHIQNRCVVVSDHESISDAPAAAERLPLAGLSRFALINALTRIAIRDRGQNSQPAAHQVLQEALARVARGGAHRGDFAISLRPLLEAGTRVLRLEGASAWRFLDSPKRLRCVASVDAVGESTLEGAEFPAASCPAYCASLASARVLAIADLQSDARASELTGTALQPPGSRALIDAPIHLDGEVVGVLRCACTRGARAWSEEEQQVAATLADYAQLVMLAHGRTRDREALAHGRQELARSERLANLGMLAESLAGEIALALKGIAERARRLVALPLDAAGDGDGGLIGILSECETALARLDPFASAIGGRQRIPGQVDVHVVIDACLSLALRMVPPTVVFSARLEARARVVTADALEVQGSLLGLLLASARSLPSGGTVTITTADARRESGPPRLEVRIGAEGPGNALLSAGTLASAAAVAERLGGGLESDPIAGASLVELTLPTSGESHQRTGGRAVLIACDHPLAGEAMERMLGFFGYDTMARVLGDSIATLNERKDDIHVVIVEAAGASLDVTALVRAMRLVKPTLRILLLGEPGLLPAVLRDAPHTSVLRDPDTAALLSEVGRLCEGGVERG